MGEGFGRGGVLGADPRSREGRVELPEAFEQLLAELGVLVDVGRKLGHGDRADGEVSVREFRHVLPLVIYAVPAIPAGRPSDRRG